MEMQSHVLDAVITYDLKKNYNNFLALKGFNIEVPKGSVLAIVGAKGCGKTTALRILAGLTEPSGGECSVLGLTPYHEPHKLHEQIGVVTNTAKLYAGMTLNKNLLLYAELLRIDNNDAIDRISFLLHTLDIWKYRDVKVEDLPTNAEQRANIARALIHRPNLLFLDEPTEGMDAETSILVKDLINYIVAEEDATVVMCTRVLNHAEMLADNFVIMDKGEIVAKGTIETLRKISGLKAKAAFRLANGSKAPQGFVLKDNFWIRSISNEEEMPKLISDIISNDCKLYEVNVINPSLEDIYKSFLSDTPEVGEEIDATNNQDTNEYGQTQTIITATENSGAPGVSADSGNEPPAAVPEQTAEQASGEEAEETVVTMVDS